MSAVELECSECGHPASHHDAGECWTDPQGREVFENVADQCRCNGFEVSA